MERGDCLTVFRGACSAPRDGTKRGRTKGTGQKKKLPFDTSTDYAPSVGGEEPREKKRSEGIHPRADDNQVTTSRTGKKKCEGREGKILSGQTPFQVPSLSCPAQQTHRGNPGGVENSKQASMGPAGKTRKTPAEEPIKKIPLHRRGGEKSQYEYSKIGRSWVLKDNRSSSKNSRRKPPKSIGSGDGGGQAPQG